MSRDFEVGINVSCEELTVSPIQDKFIHYTPAKAATKIGFSLFLTHSIRKVYIV